MQAVVENQPPNAASARDSAPASKSAANGAEPGLRLEAGRFRSLVEQLPLSVYIDRLDDVSSNVYTSPQIEPMLGYSSVEWVEGAEAVSASARPASGAKCPRCWQVRGDVEAGDDGICARCRRVVGE